MVPSRIFFDNSAFGKLIAPASAVNEILYGAVWARLQEFYGGTLPFNFTTTGFIESVGLQVPAVPHTIANQIRSCTGADFRSSGLEHLTNFYAGEKNVSKSKIFECAEQKLAAASLSLGEGKQLAENTIGSFINDSRPEERVWASLAWSQLPHMLPKNDSAAFFSILYPALEAVKKRSLPFVTLGDDLHWRNPSFLVNGHLPFKPTEKGKIIENKDWLDAEVIQAAILGPLNAGTENALVVTEDIGFLEARICRAIVFYDWVRSWAYQYTQLTPPTLLLGEVLVVAPDASPNLQIGRLRVFEIIEKMTFKYGFEPLSGVGLIKKQS